MARLLALVSFLWVPSAAPRSLPFTTRGTLTIALFTAIHEQTMATQSKIARAVNDVRSMVDLGAPLEQLISYGQDTNVFPRDVEVVLSQLLPVLTDAGST